MAAVDELLQHLRSMDRAVDAISSNNVSDPDLQSHLARGVAVHGLVCVEMFLRARIVEWTAALTAARLPPTHLPGGTKQFEDRIVEVLPRTLKGTDVGHRSQLLDDVGKALTSLSSGSFTAHPLGLRWPGSNIQGSDIEVVLSFFGIERSRVWSELTGLWRQLDAGFPGNTNLKGLF